MSKKQIYLDYGASTPVHPQVIEAMIPYWTETYGAPSALHEFGRSAKNAVENSRRMIADLLNSKPEEIVFTSCGTESDNMALRGVMWGTQKHSTKVDKNHMIISCIEHDAVLNTAKQLRDYLGFDLAILPVDEYGQIDVEEVEVAIRSNTGVISIMAANDEVGTMQPINEIGEVAHAHNVIFHTDAIQAAGIKKWDMAIMPIDLVSIAPDKFYGPKGVGILYVRDGIMLTGYRHEGGHYDSTTNVAGIVGAAEAFRLAMERLETNNAHYISLRDHLIKGVLASIAQDCILTGHPVERLPHNASFAFRNISSNDLIMHLDNAGISVSGGSACKTGDPKPSSTLQAMGLSDEWTRGGLRLTIGDQNTIEDIDYVLDTLPRIVEKLNQL